MEDTVARNQRTPEQIRAEIAAHRHAMTVGIEGLVSEVHPTAVKGRAIKDAKQAIANTRDMVTETIEESRSYFVDEGGVRWNNVGTVALIVVGSLAVLGVIGGTAALIRKVSSR